MKFDIMKNINVKLFMKNVSKSLLVVNSWGVRRSLLAVNRWEVSKSLLAVNRWGVSKSFIVAIALTFMLSILTTGCNSKVEASEEVQEEVIVEEVVEAYGTVIAKEKVNVPIEFPFQVVELYAEEGQSVHRGDVLFRIDADEYKRSVANQEKAIEIAKLELVSIFGDAESNVSGEEELLLAKIEAERKLLNNVYSANKNIKNELKSNSGTKITSILNSLDNEKALLLICENEIVKSNDLFLEGIVSEAELKLKLNEKEQLNYSISETELRLNATKESMDDQIKDFDYQTIVHETSVKELEARLSKINVTYQLKLLEIESLEETYNQLIDVLDKAYLDDKGNVICFVEEGVFSNFKYIKGDYVSGNKLENIFTLIDTSMLEIHAEVPEDFIKDVHLGAIVNIIPVAARDKNYTGTVTYISDIAYDSGSENVVMVYIGIDNNDGLLKMNYSVDVEIKEFTN